MKNEKINLLFSGNDYAFDGIVTSLLSITKHCSSPLDVIVFTMDLSSRNEKWKPLNDKHLSVFNNIVKKANGESNVKLIDVTNEYLECLSGNVNEQNLYTPFAMIRLLADKVNMPDKVLYLDTDIIAMKNIKELWSESVEGYYFAGALDYYGKLFISPKYVNSGVMLLNMKYINEHKFFEKCRKIIHEKKMKFPDQTALNKIGKGKIKIISSKFNAQKKLGKNTVIRHFAKTIIWLPYFHTRNIKPWDKKNMHKYKIHYCDDIIEEYLKIKIEFINNG